MIYSFRFVDFQDIVDCNAFAFNSRETFPKVNFEFISGNVYGLISDFGCGSWGLATCIGGRASAMCNGRILINGIESSPSDLSKYACFISENVFYEIEVEKSILSTPREYIEEALSISSQPYSVNQIKALFHLSDERFERSLSYASGEIWSISMAINFALGKQIFCFPWLNAIDINRFVIAYRQGIIDLLKSTYKIIIVPSSQDKILKKYCNHTLTVKNGKWKQR